MSRDRFARLLALHGPDLSSWPERERDAALWLLRRSEAERTRLLVATEADPKIVAQAAAADTALVERLLATTMRSIADAEPVLRPPRRLRLTRPAIRWSALAACALLGMWVGWTAQSAAPPATLLASLQLTPIADPAP